jgi:hypothetical protein
MLPTVVRKSASPSAGVTDHLPTTTYRCLFKQLPCLYALPQCSHLSSPLAAFSFFDRRDPSLALRILGFVRSTAWKDDNDGPSRTALPESRSSTEACCGRLLGKGGWPPSFNVANAALDRELLLFGIAAPSATTFSTAVLSTVGLLTGEKVELFLLPMRWEGFKDPSEAVWEWDRLYEFRIGRLDALEPTERRRWLEGLLTS